MVSSIAVCYRQLMSLAAPPRKSRAPSAKILLVDDHAVFRHGLRKLLAEYPEFAVCGEASRAQDVTALVERHQPDLVILDLALGDMNGIELTRLLKQRFPTVRVLIVSMHSESLYASRALSAGALGYVMKQDTPEQLLSAIRHVMAGDFHFGPAVVADLVGRMPGAPPDNPSPDQCLSNREMEVFRRIGTGEGTRQIAIALTLSVKTIESYRAHIKEKLHYDSSYEMVKAAIGWSQLEKLR